MENKCYREIETFKVNTEIWIAENVSIGCYAHYSWWNKFWVKLLLGWKIKSKYEEN